MLASLPEWGRPAMGVTSYIEKTKRGPEETKQNELQHPTPKGTSGVCGTLCVSQPAKELFGLVALRGLMIKMLTIVVEVKLSWQHVHEKHNREEGKKCTTAKGFKRVVSSGLKSMPRLKGIIPGAVPSWVAFGCLPAITHLMDSWVLCRLQES